MSRVAAGTKLIVVSNREPYLHERVAEGNKVIRSAGGMAAALHPILCVVGGTWIAHGAGSAYRMANAVLVTSLHDGMNLVAKEFISSRVDGDGILLLSRCTGAAKELGEAPLLVNPFDLDQMAEAMYQAYRVPEEERRVRMERMRDQVEKHTVFGVERLCRLLHYDPSGGGIFYAGDDENNAAAMRWVLARKGTSVAVGGGIRVPGARPVAGPYGPARTIRAMTGDAL